MKFRNISFFISFILFSISLQGQETYRGNSHGLTLLDKAPVPSNLSSVIRNIPYPPQAIEAGVEGMVQVMFQVDAFGNYVSHQVTMSSHPLLSSAIQGRLSCISFSPAVHEGEKVPGWIAIPFRFKLKKLPRSTGFERGELFICPPNSENPNKRIVKVP